jgi:hypothetical protein
MTSLQVINRPGLLICRRSIIAEVLKKNGDTENPLYFLRSVFISESKQCTVVLNSNYVYARILAGSALFDMALLQTGAQVRSARLCRSVRGSKGKKIPTKMKEKGQKSGVGSIMSASPPSHL